MNQHGAHSRESSADARSCHCALGDRKVLHAIGAKLLDQTGCGAEYPRAVIDELAKDAHLLTQLHRLDQRLVEGLRVRELMEALLGDRPGGRAGVHLIPFRLYRFLALVEGMPIELREQAIR